MIDAGGDYLTPAIFDEVNPDHTIAQEETFGPLMSVFIFEDEAQAIKLANNSHCGFAAHIATENISRAHRFSQSLNAGLVIVSGNSELFGGHVELGMVP